MFQFKWFIVVSKIFKYFKTGFIARNPLQRLGRGGLRWVWGLWSAKKRKTGILVYRTFNALQIDKLNRKHLLTQKMHSQCEKRLANKVKIVENKQSERGGQKKKKRENEWKARQFNWPAANTVKQAKRGWARGNNKETKQKSHTHAHVFCKNASKQLSGRQRRRQQR